jgi:hypothetical protein
MTLSDLVIFGIMVANVITLVVTTVVRPQKSHDRTEAAGITAPRKTRKGTEEGKGSNTKMQENNEVRVLLERYRQSWNMVRLIHDTQWKSMTVVITIVGVFMGISSTRPSLLIPLSVSSFFLIALGASMLVKDRVPFLSHMMIIARIEELLDLQRSFPQFRDGFLLPAEFIATTGKTYNQYLKEMKWKKTSLFFLLLLFYVFLAVAVAAVAWSLGGSVSPQ